MSVPQWFPAEAPVDDEVLELLTNQACFAAGQAWLDHLGDVSRIPNPDGSPQGLTPNEMTTLQVRAALRNLLANRLVTAPPVDAMRAIFESGVTVQ